MGGLESDMTSENEISLENIGFYTLSDKRAMNSSYKSPLWRCELLLTNRCNFRCPYCRHLSNIADLPFENAKVIVEYWISEGLKNIRFSGGEPTLYLRLQDLVEIAALGHVERIAISTNGSQTSGYYRRLIDCGVNDFSISLDACCASTGDIMAGKNGAWENVIRNIELLSSLTYVTVGIVINENNEHEAVKTIELAHSLGVAEILGLSLPHNIINIWI